jgi:hypothetical protein
MGFSRKVGWRRPVLLQLRTTAHIQHKNNCGSEPVGDGDIAFNIFVECDTAIASRLAPTGDVLD